MHPIQNTGTMPASGPLTEGIFLHGIHRRVKPPKTERRVLWRNASNFAPLVESSGAESQEKCKAANTRSKELTLLVLQCSCTPNITYVSLGAGRERLAARLTGVDVYGYFTNQLFSRIGLGLPATGSPTRRQVGDTPYYKRVFKLQERQDKERKGVSRKLQMVLQCPDTSTAGIQQKPRTPSVDGSALDRNEGADAAKNTANRGRSPAADQRGKHEHRTEISRRGFGRS
ncbi:hypothetical protein EDB92DRAFT_2101305 [Lactarius akahatsu]|uniref:Uncharacterized protein n=1 Tax=Lactarius akahatsu TaxID=416441 RepID=A0AAD4LNN1_9AGAM|nr:hypothetical protein EDB92DRAFT_2101305 [Lactarius akahatsu]